MFREANPITGICGFVFFQLVIVFFLFNGFKEKPEGHPSICWVPCLELWWRQVEAKLHCNTFINPRITVAQSKEMDTMRAIPPALDAQLL